MKSDPLQILIHFDRWATERLFGACRDLDEAALDRQFAIGMGSLRKTFTHLIANMEWWYRLEPGT